MAGKRCLVLSCSQIKRDDAGFLPAIERYDGPAFRVARKFLREAPPALQNVDVFILSARYGLIAADTEIADYDQRMTVERAQELQEKVCAAFQKQIAQGSYAEVFLSLGCAYRTALNGCKALLPHSHLVESSVSSGKKLTELKAWLYGRPLSEAERDEPAPAISLQAKEKGQAVLRGVVIEMTREQVLAVARRAMVKGRGNPARYRHWYVQVDDQRVGSKWLVSQLTGLHVSAFVADEARRVLRQLGVQVYRDA